jgi:hypothetical protein
MSNSYTMKVTPYPAWPNWGIIGSATITGWDSDTNLDYNFKYKNHASLWIWLWESINLG